MARTRVSLPGLIRQLPAHKPWMISISILAVAVVLAACGFGTYSLFQNREYVPETSASASSGPTVQWRDITTRDADPVPLSIADVFPGREIPASTAEVPYTMLGDPQALDDCSGTAQLTVARILVDAGCTQFVRASFAGADDRYYFTTGILNMPDKDAAETFVYSLKQIASNQGSGNLTGWNSEPGTTDALFSANPHVEFKARGHLLLYVLVVHRDGTDIDVVGEQEALATITNDVIESYLSATVVEEWSKVKDETTPPTDASVQGSESASAPAS